MTLRDLSIGSDDRLALLVAGHHAAGEQFAKEDAIRIALGRRRLQGLDLRRSLRALQREGLLTTSGGPNWTLTGKGFCEVVNGQEPAAVIA